MPERNFCVETGCKGYCCENIDMPLTIFERRRIFPQAIRVESIKQLVDIIGVQLGVFYTRVRREKLGMSGFSLVALSGPCPNRLKEGSCGIHDEREYAARNFKIGCNLCNEIRTEHGLLPVISEKVACLVVEADFMTVQNIG